MHKSPYAQPVDGIPEVDLRGRSYCDHGKGNTETNIDRGKEKHEHQCWNPDFDNQHRGPDLLKHVRSLRGVPSNGRHNCIRVKVRPGTSEAFTGRLHGSLVEDGL